MKKDLSWGTKDEKQSFSPQRRKYGIKQPLPKNLSSPLAKAGNVVCRGRTSPVRDPDPGKHQRLRRWIGFLGLFESCPAAGLRACACAGAGDSRAPAGPRAVLSLHATRLQAGPPRRWKDRKST